MSVEISEDVINRNNEFYVRYLSLKQAKNKTEFELKRRKFSYRKYFHYELKTLFPLITVLNLKDVSVVVNKESFVKTYGTKMPESVKEFYLIFSTFSGEYKRYSVSEELYFLADEVVLGT